ncbi:hypothetical protein FRC03_002391 [Tulasnella sp. 419]|nr:hypothetical protein FRC03_002391 [Tulasnella sp. 419]
MSKLFDVTHQLVFYGAYHSNKVNVLIHIICVPLILWSAQVFLAALPVPEYFPHITTIINRHLTFEYNWSAVLTAIYLSYYTALEPVAAILYAPQLIFSYLFATSCAHKPDGIKQALALHVFSWIMQFIGHTWAEGRAPALFDNLVGALVLAPFFVHLELLFKLGYNHELQRKVINGIGVEVAKFRREEAQKKRGATANGSK